jgi:hypothetical protein
LLKKALLKTTTLKTKAAQWLPKPFYKHPRQNFQKTCRAAQLFQSQAAQV